MPGTRPSTITHPLLLLLASQGSMCSERPRPTSVGSGRGTGARLVSLGAPSCAIIASLSFLRSCASCCSCSRRSRRRGKTRKHALQATTPEECQASQWVPPACPAASPRDGPRGMPWRACHRARPMRAACSPRPSASAPKILRRSSGWREERLVAETSDGERGGPARSPHKAMIDPKMMERICQLRGNVRGDVAARATSQYPRPLWLLKRCDLGGSPLGRGTDLQGEGVVLCGGHDRGRVLAQGGGRRLNEVQDKR